MELPALVGPSGSGKSTVSRLIARFWDVDSGAITIGGVDIKAFDPEHLMSYMSFVFQDVVLFNDTVYNNIRIGNMDASHTEIMAAAKAACCDEFALKLPQGFDTVLGENGSTLSGGERQRLSIARALLKNAPIVLLDEATASLDPENESYIQQAISRLISGKTVVVIAHRLRTIVDADQIIVLNEGRLEEQGTHRELFDKNGLYHKLYSIQQGKPWLECLASKRGGHKLELGKSLEDYLEAVLILTNKNGSVRSVDIARHMNFSKGVYQPRCQRITQERILDC